MITESQSARPLAAGLLTEEAEPRLIGGRHRTSGRIVFPCPQGSERTDYEAVPLSRTGSLWSWTVQRFRPKTPPYAGPDTFEPFAVGYVELPGEAIVEARLTDVAFEALAVGLPMRLTVMPFSTSEDGAIVTTYAFRPDRERMS
ncbi:MAG TPA: OB-fold domain-containing protein [Sphingomonas sp.]